MLKDILLKVLSGVNWSELIAKLLEELATKPRNMSFPLDSGGNGYEVHVTIVPITVDGTNQNTLKG